MSANHVSQDQSRLREDERCRFLFFFLFFFLVFVFLFYYFFVFLVFFCFFFFLSFIYFFFFFFFLFFFQINVNGIFFFFVFCQYRRVTWLMRRKDDTRTAGSKVADASPSRLAGVAAVPQASLRVMHHANRGPVIEMPRLTAFFDQIEGRGEVNPSTAE